MGAYMLFVVGNSIMQAYEGTKGFCFIIDGAIVIPQFDEESCFVVINNARLNVTYI